MAIFLKIAEFITMSKNKQVEYGKALPTDYESMEIGKTYWDDASDYGLLRDDACSLYIVRKEHFFLTALPYFFNKHVPDSGVTLYRSFTGVPQRKYFGIVIK